MSLGFTVEQLVSAGRGGARLHMGLVPLGEAEWLNRHFDHAARRQVFAAHPEAIAVTPEAEPAAREAAQMVAGCDTLAGAAAQVWEDLCVMEADPTGAYRLTAGAVGFPTDWDMRGKLGLNLLAMHAPIHGYSEQLSAGVERFFAKLKPGAIYGRANWFIVANADWRYLPADDPAMRFAHVTTANAGASLFIRCERQTLRRLPQTGAVLFTIGVAVSPLADLSHAVVGQLAAGVAAMSEGEHARRAAPHYAGALAEYATKLLENAA